MTSENPENSIRQKQTTPNTETKPGDHSEKPNPPISPVVAIPNPPPPSDKHCEITVNTKRDRIDEWTLRMGAFGLFVLIIYTIFTGLMYCANKKAADAAKSAADTAQRQVADSEAAESGRVEIEFDPEVRDGGNFAMVNGDITASNIGRTELTNVGALCTSWYSHAPQEPRNVAPTDFPNGGTIYPGKPPQSVCKIGTQLAQWEPIKKGQSFAGFSFAVSYRNIFGQLHVKQGCFMYIARNQKFGPCPIPSKTPASFP